MAGLDQYEVRKWEGWYRHVTLAIAGPRLPVGSPATGQRRSRGQKGGDAGWDASLILFTVPEVRRLLCRLIWWPSGSPELSLAWSRWSRRHHARARRCHYQRRLHLLNNYLRWEIVPPVQ